MDLGSVIVFHRKRKGWTQQDFANRMITTEATVNRWENNKAVPRAKAKSLMADLFGISVSELTENQGTAVINEVSLKAATVPQWLRSRQAEGYALTLITRAGHFNMVVARYSEEKQMIDVLTGVFELEDILPLIKEGVIPTFCEPSLDVFNRIRGMQLREPEIYDLLKTAQRFESNKVYQRLLDEARGPRNSQESVHLEKWRQLTPAQKKSIEVMIDINLNPEETDMAELERLMALASEDDVNEKQ